VSITCPYCKHEFDEKTYDNRHVPCPEDVGDVPIESTPRTLDEGQLFKEWEKAEDKTAEAMKEMYESQGRQPDVMWLPKQDWEDLVAWEPPPKETFNAQHQQEPVNIQEAINSHRSSCGKCRQGKHCCDTKSCRETGDERRGLGPSS